MSKEIAKTLIDELIKEMEKLKKKYDRKGITKTEDELIREAMRILNKKWEKKDKEIKEDMPKIYQKKVNKLLDEIE